jgi:hypothetical protein
MWNGSSDDAFAGTARRRASPTRHDRPAEIKLRDSRCAYNGFLADLTPEEIAMRSTLA